MRKRLWLLMFPFMLACNLSTTSPTSTPFPTFTPLPLVAPTLLPDSLLLTPLAPLGTNSLCPATPPGWIPYVVEPGDTLGLLADQTTSSVDEITQGNCRTDADTLLVGETLYLPRQPVLSP